MGANAAGSFTYEFWSPWNGRNGGLHKPGHARPPRWEMLTPAGKCGCSNHADTRPVASSRVECFGITSFVRGKFSYSEILFDLSYGCFSLGNVVVTEPHLFLWALQALPSGTTAPQLHPMAGLTGRELVSVSSRWGQYSQRENSSPVLRLGAHKRYEDRTG